MENLTKKSVALKIAIILVIVLLFNFSAPTISQAGVAEVIGGTLLSPIVDLLLAIGDGIMNLLQGIIFGMDGSLTKVSTEIGDTLPTVVAWLVGIAIVVGTAIITGGLSLVALVAAGIGAYYAYNITADMLPETFYLPMYAISPEEIFSNQIALLDVNFFNPNDDKYETIQTVNGQTSTDQISTASQLQQTIASWYLTLRNFALVVLLSVLLYIGIRIVTSSAASDKAKYKEKLFSWIVAMCILFFMHYIMAFAVTVVEAISEGINEVDTPVIIELPNLQEEGYYIEVIDDDTGEAATEDASTFFYEQGLIADESADEYYWPTNLMGQVRLDLQLDKGSTDDNELLRQVGYTVLFLILVMYTIGFLVVYLKRLIMLAFLTMIAPLVAMTYPLDKMGDGNAQAFNMWIKEYAFNLLIQPLHLILYTMLVGSAISLAAQSQDGSGVNMIYAIVALGFIFEAEKIMKRFFGFDKASTVDTNGSAVGGALAMAGVNQLRKLAGGGPRKGGAGSGGSGGGQGNAASKAASRKIKTRELLNQITGRGRNGGTTGADGADGADTTAFLLPDQVENGRSNEWNRLNNVQNALDREHRDGLMDDETYQQRARELRESDTRGIRTWAGDLYQGSRLQGRIQGASDWAGTHLHAAVDAAKNSTIAGWGRSLGAGARSVRDMAARGVQHIPKPIRNSVRTLGGNVATVAKGVAAVGADAIKENAPKVGAAAVKGLAKTTLAGTAATLSMAGAIASSEKNVLKYGAAGAATGWAIGEGATRIGEGAVDGVNNAFERAKSTYTEATSGAEANAERIMAAEEKEAMKDKDRQKLFSEKLGVSGDELKDVMEAASEYRKNGVMDDNLIIKAMQSQGFGNSRDSQEKILLAALATETGNDNKKISDMQSRLEERGLSSAEVKKYVDAVRELTGAI